MHSRFKRIKKKLKPSLHSTEACHDNRISFCNFPGRENLFCEFSMLLHLLKKGLGITAFIYLNFPEAQNGRSTEGSLQFLRIERERGIGALCLCYGFVFCEEGCKFDLLPLKINLSITPQSATMLRLKNVVHGKHCVNYLFD